METSLHSPGYGMADAGDYAPSHRAASFGATATLLEHTTAAAALCKALSHGGRLRILCHLLTGEKSVGELEQFIGCRQAAVSQQLSRLREDGLVTTRREGKAIFYSLQDPKVQSLLVEMMHLFTPQRSAL